MYTNQSTPIFRELIKKYNKYSYKVYIELYNNY